MGTDEEKVLAIYMSVYLFMDDETASLMSTTRGNTLDKMGIACKLAAEQRASTTTTRIESWSPMVSVVQQTATR